MVYCTFVLAFSCHALVFHMYMYYVFILFFFPFGVFANLLGYWMYVWRFVITFLQSGTEQVMIWNLLLKEDTTYKTRLT